ncbi:disintegrin and metalloproteinase domain-containing protein 15-like [Rhincodon typus]|uniref:disintegrin and metalloproteinase domain-containing protein 15-like n=1 Tax=Rhincodon typus TaxID=259920 RepID=UPI00202F7350|nr:disintegrin and metalloproteinase domain-containing protein 15-like [Rhincodon typus]
MKNLRLTMGTVEMEKCSLSPVTDPPVIHQELGGRPRLKELLQVNKELLQAWYPSHIRISVILEGKDLTLDLDRNRFLLPRGFQVSHYDSNGTLVTENDTEMYLYLDRNKEAVVRRMINVAGTVDMYYRPFNIRVALIGVEVWTTNQITIDRSASRTLNRFLHWRKKTLLPRLHNDNAHLVTRSSFTNGVAGLAPGNGICTVDNSGGVNTVSTHSLPAPHGFYHTAVVKQD